jgi:hypothetical protein
MADYYSPTVVDPAIPFGDMTALEQLLLTQIFDSEIIDDALYFFEEQSTSDMLWLDAGEARGALAQSQSSASKANDLVAAALAELELGAEDVELDLSMESWEFLFQDIIRRSATITHVTVTTSFTCSKMRPDGFGGMVTVITGDQVLSSSTGEMLCSLLDRADYGELACAPGHGHHVVLRLSEEEVRGTMVEIFETEASPGLVEDDVTDDDIRVACIAAIDGRDLSHEHGELIFAAALRALNAAAERKHAGG